jgi:hypothetical protein
VNAAEVAQLLGIASTLDNRISAGSKMQVRTWSHVLDDVPYPVAERALREHYRRSTDTIMPADIVEHWRITRREVAERRHHAELRAHTRPRQLDEAARLRVIRAGIARVTAALAITRGLDPEHAQAEADSRRAWLAVPCPHCHASPDHPCTGPGGRPLRKTPAHPTRLDAARTTSHTTGGTR